MGARWYSASEKCPGRTLSPAIGVAHSWSADSSQVLGGVMVEAWRRSRTATAGVNFIEHSERSEKSHTRSGQSRTLRTQRSGQRVHDKRIGCNNRDKLFAGAIGIGNRIRVAAAFELRDPQFPPGLRVERAKPVVVGAADENQSARRDDRAREHRTPCVLFRFRELIGYTERPLPREIAGGSVHGDETTPWRFLAGPALTVHPDVERAIDAPFLIGHRKTFLGFLNPAQGANVLRCNEDKSCLPVVRGSAPVRSAKSAGKHQRAFRRRALRAKTPRGK